MTATTQDTSAARMHGVLVGIALTAGLLIALVHEATQPRVAAQRAALLTRSVAAVLPQAVTFASYDERLQRLPAALDPGAALFLGVDGAGRPVGVAVPAGGMGYQDRIGLVFGFEPDAGRMLGMRVLESRETPGLGARIVDDADFLEGFEQLVLQFDDQGRPLPIRVVADARPEAGEVDGITGATVSVRAVARIIGSSLEVWLPRLEPWYPPEPEVGDG